MTPTAIHQAIRLNKYPEEMTWLHQSNRLLPVEVTELLKLASSHQKMKDYAENNGIDESALKKLLLNFIELVLLNEDNSDEKTLGLNDNSDAKLRKLHYKLLSKIYHPDKNSSSNAEHISRINKAYQQLKNQPDINEFKNIRISRVPPKSFYTATNQAEKHISSLKYATAAIFAFAVFSTVLITSLLYEPAKQELFSKTETIKAIEAPQKAPLLSKPLNSVSTLETVEAEDTFRNPFSLARKASVDDDSNNQQNLHFLLTSIELAYEKGDALNILRILNSPEIKEQSDKEVISKLENLFRITSKRKMLLYDFEWNNLSGNIFGKGKFLSRYYLNDQDQWLTREGVASLHVSKTDTMLNITSLKLENKNIDQ